MKTEYDKVFIDTNILIYLTFEDFDHEKHVQSIDRLNKIRHSGTTFVISAQILREYFAIATNNNIFKKPLNQKQALAKMKEFMALFAIVSEKESTINVLIRLLTKYPVSRHKIHDMNIAATMIDHGIPALLTYNVKDFKPINEIQLLQ